MTWTLSVPQMESHRLIEYSWHSPFVTHLGEAACRSRQLEVARTYNKVNLWLAIGFRIFAKWNFYRTTEPRMKQFLTLSMCGYFSGSVTLMSVSLMLRYWSTLCKVPVMLQVRSFNKSPAKRLRNFSPEIVLELYDDVFADQGLEEGVEQLQSKQWRSQSHGVN